jgi:hypothetical protein
VHHLGCVTVTQGAGGKQLLIKPARAQEKYERNSERNSTMPKFDVRSDKY